MKNSILTVFIKWCFAIFVFFFLIYQSYHALYNPLTTGAAISYETYEGIPIVAVTIRNEIIIEGTPSGALSYQIEEGGRVAKNGTIAKIYATEDDANAELRIEELNSKIQNLTTIQRYNDLEAVDLDLLGAQIDTALLSFLDIGSRGNYSEINEKSERLVNLLNRRQIVTGKVGGFNDIINTLKSERDALVSQTRDPSQTITSEYAGYFISKVDGCENKISSGHLTDVTPEMLDAVNPLNNNTGIIGKVVSDYEWYIAATISFNDSLKLRDGSSMTLLTNLETMPELPVSVKHINKGSSGDNAVVVFGCKYMNSELANIRKQPMTIVLKEYEGLRINSKAIRVVDGKQGVYILNGSEVRFAPVNIIYSTENYAVCEKQDGGKNKLKLYDEVVIRGKNLYDGKIIK